jgi:O-antigen/teichoic acid export membrane protein
MVVTFYRDELARLVNAPDLASYLWLLPIGLCFMGLYQALNYWAVRKKAFELIAQTKMTQSVGLVLTQVSIGLMRSGPGGLIIGFIVGHAAGSSSFATRAWRRDSAVLEQVTLAGISEVARRHWRFPVFSASAALLNVSSLQLPAILLAALYGPQVAGWFLLSQRLIGLPMFVVGTSIAQVFYGEAAQRVREAPGTLRELLYSTTRKTFLLALPIGGMALLGPWFFGFVFGEAWFEAGTYTQVLALTFVLQFTTSPVTNLNIYARNGWMLAWDAGRFMLMLGGFALAYTMEWSPLASIALYGSVMSVSYMVLYGLNLLAIRQWEVLSS